MILSDSRAFQKTLKMQISDHPSPISIHGLDQEEEVNTSNLADPMIMAIITSRRKKRANA